ncbi:hypothetical protein [Alicyclobacillus fructus]|uniref:hypothetical protein n=1 Tax=Alicyclobacillus fructus TaxID=2816082 RepID=UPI001A90AAF1|nr:hypothetical protein [Alicyclobacillus fructus]
MNKRKVARASIISSASVLAVFIVLGLHDPVAHAGRLILSQPPSPDPHTQPGWNAPLPQPMQPYSMIFGDYFYGFDAQNDQYYLDQYSCASHGQTGTGPTKVELSWPAGGGVWDRYYTPSPGTPYPTPQGLHQYMQFPDYLFYRYDGKDYWDGYIMQYNDMNLPRGIPNGYIMPDYNDPDNINTVQTLVAQMGGNYTWMNNHFLKNAAQTVSGTSSSSVFGGGSNSFPSYSVVNFSLVSWLSGAITLNAQETGVGSPYYTGYDRALWASFCDTAINYWIKEILFAPTLQSNTLALSARYPTVVAGQNEVIHVVGAQYTYETQAHLEAAELIGPNGTKWFTKSDFQNDYGSYPGGGTFIWDPYSAGYSQAFASAFASGPHNGGPDSEDNPDDMVWIKGGRPGGYGSAVNYISENMTLNTKGWAPGTYKLNLWELDQFARGNLSQYDPTTGYSPPIEFAA